MKIKCLKCGMVAPPSRFRSRRDLWGTTYIAWCPVCRNRACAQPIWNGSMPGGDLNGFEMIQEESDYQERRAMYLEALRTGKRILVVAGYPLRRRGVFDFNAALVPHTMAGYMAIWGEDVMRLLWEGDIVPDLAQTRPDAAVFRAPGDHLPAPGLSVGAGYMFYHPVTNAVCVVTRVDGWAVSYRPTSRPLASYPYLEDSLCWVSDFQREVVDAGLEFFAEGARRRAAKREAAMRRLRCRWRGQWRKHLPVKIGGRGV